LTIPLIHICLLGLVLLLPPDDFAYAAETVPPAKQPWQILALAQKLEAQKKYAEAAAAYEEYLFLRPANDKARLALGKIRLAQQNFGEARKHFEEIASKDLTNHAARRGFADALYLGGQPALALKEYESLYAETKDPEIADQISKVTGGMEKPAAAPQEPT